MTILYTKYQISYRKNQTAVNGVIYEKSFRVFFMLIALPSRGFIINFSI